jgi:hypothetical protein
MTLPRESEDSAEFCREISRQPIADSGSNRGRANRLVTNFSALCGFVVNRTAEGISPADAAGCRGSDPWRAYPHDLPI